MKPNKIQSIAFFRPFMVLVVFVFLSIVSRIDFLGVVSGTALRVNHVGLADLVAAHDAGVENVPHEMLSALYGGKIVIPLYVLLIFLSTVTTCDLYAVVMGDILTSGISLDSPEE